MSFVYPHTATHEEKVKKKRCLILTRVSFTKPSGKVKKKKKKIRRKKKDP